MEKYLEITTIRLLSDLRYLIFHMASCKDYALKYINRYPKTEEELRVKLLTKHYSEEEIDNTISWLKHMKWVDDEQFARLYFQSESVKKGKPPYLVKQKLLQK